MPQAFLVFVATLMAFNRAFPGCFSEHERTEDRYRRDGYDLSSRGSRDPVEGNLMAVAHSRDMAFDGGVRDHNSAPG